MFACKIDRADISIVNLKIYDGIIKKIKDGLILAKGRSLSSHREWGVFFVFGAFHRGGMNVGPTVASCRGGLQVALGNSSQILSVYLFIY